jgi:hypothetical protein
LGNRLGHEGLGLGSASPLHQHHLVGDLRRRCRQALFKRQQVFWGLGKGLIE